MHAASVVHRDVKPGNVLLTTSWTVKLGDFGLARIVDNTAEITTGGEVMGTAAYLSPEQVASAAVLFPSDVYSLGLVLLECLTGHREYDGDPATAALARLLRRPAVPDFLPAPWPQLADGHDRPGPPTPTDHCLGLGDPRRGCRGVPREHSQQSESGDPD